MPVLDVQWLLPDGRAGGRDEDGIPVRLLGAVVGDRVQYTAVARSGRTVEGVVDAILVPSPQRRQPPCPFHDACGGCDLAALVPEARRDALAHVAARALGRDSSPEMVASPRPVAHRARIQLTIAEGRVGYRPAGSHDLVEIDVCAIARPEVQAALPPLRTVDLRGLSRVEIRSDGARAVYAFTSAGRYDRDALASLGDVAVDGRALAGDPTLQLTVRGTSLRASPRSFYQVNLEINALLVDWVVEAVRAQKAERILDLYAGIGNLSLPMAAEGIPVVAVELEGQAIADLRASAGDLPVEAHAGRVERFDTTHHPFDVAVLDPPRAGARGVLKRLALTRPRAIVYVSCHVPSAARDLRELKGYRLADACCFEMFPDTHHFETALLLERQ